MHAQAVGFRLGDIATASRLPLALRSGLRATGPLRFVCGTRAGGLHCHGTVDTALG